MTIELPPHDQQVDAVTANEELIERISVAQAIAKFRLPLRQDHAAESEAPVDLQLAS